MDVRHDGTLPSPLEPLFERLERIYGAGALNGIVNSMREPKRVGFVINRLVSGHDRPPGEPLAGVDGCYSVPAAEREQLLEHPAVLTGACYPMNPSSVMAARALAVTGSMEVLDLAAAPGGKTLILAMDMENRGRIAAVEPVRGRFHRMRANLSRLGVTNVQYYQADGRGIGRKVPERFDRVLLDAPCSSEARIRLQDPASYAHWKPRKVKETSRKQRGLIRSAYQALKRGGEMIYCTCAFSPEENELVVDHLLRAEPEAVLLSLSGPGVPGLTSWNGRPLEPHLARCRRVLPDEVFDGFFIARIAKGP
jgi:16S rRNA (cytosine1407-C5)-methyltransferase